MNHTANYVTAEKMGRNWFPVIYIGDSRFVNIGQPRRTQIGAITTAEKEVRATMPSTLFERLAY